MGQWEAYLVDSADLAPWVEMLLARRQVIAPRAAYGSDVSYDEVSSPGEVEWEYTTSLSSLKPFLLPQTDALLQWQRRTERGLQVAPVYDDTERVFLAVRPCDVSGALFLDRVFSRDRQDAHYLRRRQNGALVALACTEPGENCFCVCAHAGPFMESGFDLQLVPLSGHYLVEVGSEKGKALVQEAAGLFKLAPPGIRKLRQQLAQAAENRFGEEKAYFAAALRRMTFDRVPEEVWAEVGARCLACGGCSFVCPTCFCFSTADSEVNGTGRRDRIWDSCSYQSYALEASGHNPRAERKHRLKARFFHKLAYQFVLRSASHGCVGCGRCAVTCPAGNDMPAVTARIRRGAM